MPGVAVERQRCVEAVLRPADERGERGVVEAFEDEHLAARQQCRVQFEAGVLGGRADKHDRAVFDVRQEGVLLGAVEPVDLVHEQHRALPDLPAVLSGLEHFAKVRDPGERCGEWFEHEAGPLREQPRDRRLPTAGWPPQDHRDQPLR